MKAAQQAVVDKFGCQSYEARDMMQAAQKLATAFARLYDRFSLDTIIATKRTIKALHFKHNQDDVKRFSRTMSFGVGEEREFFINRNRRVLPSAAKRLWKAYQAAKDVWETFDLASQGVNVEGFWREEKLTFVLEQLHVANAFSDPVKVAEGRIAFQALDGQVQLREELGLEPTYYPHQTYRPPRW